MKDQFRQWHPVEGLDRGYFTCSVSDWRGALTVVLVDCTQRQAQNVMLTFEQGMQAYQVHDRSSLALVADFAQSYWPPHLQPKDALLYRVEDSSYLGWLCEQSDGVIDPETSTHVTVVSTNLMIDVITPYDPRIEFFSSV